MDLGKKPAQDRIGDYYADRQKWAKAVQYYGQAKNYEKLVEYCPASPFLLAQACRWFGLPGHFVISWEILTWSSLYAWI